MRKTTRKKRVPFGVPRLKLSIDEYKAKLESENKVARWFKDEDNRLQRAQEGGWEFVTDEVKVGDEEEVQKGRITKPGGRGVTLYLMAIPKKFYDEDQAIKEERNKRVDAAIHGGTLEQHHGVDPNKGSHHIKKVDYAP